jgi:diguanylate cyclase (GGDEF)-like protein/PAS domain S-box-containing protein
MQMQPQVWQAVALNGALGGALVVALALLPAEAGIRPARRTQYRAGAAFALAAVLALQPPLRIDGLPGSGHLDALFAAAAAFSFGPLSAAAVVAASTLWRVATDMPQLAAALWLLLSAAGLGLAWQWLHRRFALGAPKAFTGLALCMPLPAWMVADASGAGPAALAAVSGGGTFVLAGLTELVLGRARLRMRLHRLNRKLLQREQDLSQVLEAAGGGRWEWNFVTGKPLFRGNFYDAFDFADPGRVNNWQDWRALWHPDDLQRLDAFIRRNREARMTDFDAEFRVRDRSGRWRWLLTRGRVIERNTEGQPLRMVGMHHDITAHRETEEALRSSQAKFATMYQTMPDAAGITRIDTGRYIEVNPAFCQLLGYARDDVIGRTSGELRVWETEDERRKLVGEFVRRGQVDALELKVRHQDGRIIPGQMSARRMRVGDEECFLFLFHETSAQKRVEAELRGANALLQHAGRLATLGVWEISPRQGQHYWSPVVYDIHGLPQSAPVPEDYSERFVLPPYRAGLRQAFSDCVRLRLTWDYEMEIRRTDGRAVWVRVRGEPVVEEDRVVQMRGVVQDIDESKRNLERLRQSEDLFSRMFQLMPDPLGISRQRNGHLVEVNPAWEKTLGYSRAEAIGKSVVELGILDPAEREAMVQRALITGELLSWEVHLTTRSGEQRIGLQSLRTIEIENEPCWLFVVRDITERRLAEALVREREELLSLTIEAASLGLWDWNLARGEISGDARWREHRGLTEARAYRIEELRHTALPEDPAMIQAAVQRHAQHPELPFDVVRRVLLPGGASRWVRNLGKIVARDSDGRPLRMLGVDIDVTQQREQQALLEQLAHYDALTGLPNRVLLADRLQQAMAQAERTGQLLGVAYLDLDSFKPVNDRFGHDAGDRLLVEIAQRLQQSLRAVDSVARLGGDEFVVLLADLDSVQAAEQALERVMASVAHPMCCRASASRSRPASAPRSFHWTARTPTPCCAMPTRPCMPPSNQAATACRSSIQRRSLLLATASSACCACDKPWPTASSYCTCSPRCTCARAASSVPRPWHAGSTQTKACCRLRASCP